MYKAIFDIYDKKTGRRIERIVTRNEDEYEKIRTRLYKEQSEGKITFDYDKN